MKRIAASLVFWCLLVAGAAAQTGPATVGQWAGPFSLPIVTIHMQMLPDGNVMAWGNGAVLPNDGRATVRLWNPSVTNPVFSEVPNPFVDPYCSGHVLLPNGHMLAIGGHIDANVGDDATTTFNPFTRTWTNRQRMGAGRWYPSATVLPNGDVLTTSGDIDTIIGVNTMPQVYQPSTGTWRDLTNARLSQQLYPWMHVAPNGQVFMSGPDPITRYLDVNGSGRWTDVATTNYGNRRQYQGTSVMYEPGKVMILGGGGPATPTAELIDLNQAAPRWRYTNPMAFGRKVPNATLLPDGKVLVTGGNTGDVFSDPTHAVFNAEIWNPATETWSTMAAMKTSRLYHSTAILLPDGRVYVSGGGADGTDVGDIDHYDAEIFSPPYLFKGTRPTIDSAPGSIGYGEVFTLLATDAGGIRDVTLVALSATTHEFNVSQRFLRLPFAATSDPNRYSVSAPSSANLAPPGYYMLFALNANGVPSVARIVVVGNGSGNRAPTVNAGADQTVTLPSGANLTGTASDDGQPGALTTTWSRLSGPGTVTFGNANALSTTASFSAAGTYVLRLSASDTALTSTDDVTVTVNSAAGGNGLTGQYFNGINFNTLVFTRVDPTVNFTWGNASPGAGVQADGFSIRWTGQLQPTVSGVHTFSTVSNDGVRLFLNGQLIINNWTVHGTTTDTSAGITLQAGVRYSITMEYFENLGYGVSQLLWRPPGATSSSAIPQARLLPSASSPSNQAPTVNAGPDQTITLPASANLTGTASDDGQPGALTTTWSRVSGPGTVTFGNASARSTTASFSAAGTYVLRLSASDTALTSTDDVTITVNASSSTGTGLTGRYYNGINFNTLVFTRVDPTVNFTWGNNSPGTGVPVDGFSIRWTGQLAPTVSGTYTFSTSSNDGVRVFLNNQLIINNWTVHGTTTNTSAGITLQAGVRYPITMEYFENAGWGVSILSWTPPGQSTAVIPQARLFP
jgi:hypothetical protein